VPPVDESLPDVLSIVDDVPPVVDEPLVEPG
jgi:hypothetical protein